MIDIKAHNTHLDIAGILVKKKRKTPNVPMQSMLTMKGALSWTVSVLLKNEKVQH